MNSIKKSLLTISNFNDFQNEIYLDLENLCYYQEEPLDVNSSSLSFIMDLAVFLQTANRKSKKRKKKYKARKNKRVEKIERAKKNSNKKSKIILHSGINKETNLSKAAKDYYGG